MVEIIDHRYSDVDAHGRSVSRERQIYECYKFTGDGTNTAESVQINGVDVEYYPDAGDTRLTVDGREWYPLIESTDTDYDFEFTLDAQAKYTILTPRVRWPNGALIRFYFKPVEL